MNNAHSPRHRQALIPIVWILGTSGVGKSTLGHRLLTELERAGVQAAFADADQLRLASAIDASEEDLIAASLPDLARSFQRKGARCLIVAGLADSDGQLRSLLPRWPRDRILAVHLDADEESIRRRVLERGWLTELADESAAYARRIEAGFADLRMDTSAQTPEALAQAVSHVVLDWLRRADDQTEATIDEAVRPNAHRLITITGPGGVGVSTTGYQVFAHLARSGQPVGYVDATQLGHLGSRSRAADLAPMRAANARSVARRLAEAGASTLVVSGEASSINLIEHGGEVEAHDFWLVASADALAERIAASARGDGPPVQGNHRLGLEGDELAASIEAAVIEAQDPSPRNGRRVIDTSDASPQAVAEEIVAHIQPGSVGGPVDSP